MPDINKWKSPKRTLCLQSLEERLAPAVFTVSNLEDTGTGSFREALIAANTTPGEDTIVFQNGLGGSVKVLSQLVISDSVQIIGNSSITFDGQKVSNLFSIQNTSVSFDRVNFTQSISPTVGATLEIDSKSIVTLNQTSIVNNRSNEGTIRNYGSLQINGSNISDNRDSAIVNFGNLTIRSSLFTNNISPSTGGAIRNFGSLNISTSTFSDNRASADGGAIFLGITDPDDVMVIQNSTFIDNWSVNGTGGAIASRFVPTSAPIQILSNTIVRNEATTAQIQDSPQGGGIALNGTVNATLRNNLIAENRRGPIDQQVLDDVVGTITNSSFNLLSVGEGAVGITNGVNRNQVGSIANPIDPKIGILTNNGGPTATVAIQAASPARNQGEIAGDASDQRGILRPQEEAPDIGAFEYTANNTPRRNGFAVGPGAGGGRTVIVYDAAGSERFRVDVFSEGYNQGVRVATGDIDGDGIDDLIVGSGPGVASVIEVYSGAAGNLLLYTFQPFESSFLGGVFVAAGDVNGDGHMDVAVSPDEGGGPRIRLLSGKTFEQIADFFGIEDPNFRGGARASFGDINRDGFDDLVVAAGFGGGPRIAAFNGKALGTGIEKLFSDYFAFEPTLRNGAFVAVGDINADGFADLIHGGGPGGGPRIYGLSGQTLLASNGSIQEPLTNFFVGDTQNRGGVRVAVAKLDGDNRADLITGAGDLGGGALTLINGNTLTADGLSSSPTTLEPFPGFGNGLFVG
ncbi:choice-of-anchor Q domain-containing protein [Tuwongella immobilis]|uniref:Right handed beta helix domain-containing protein n=1 Tax=Tuwongella immobilis TaxID=692036 RepID=A0A6C2YRU0_9BACT|nr:choice-of-anchor Q domain-containing protein [Tuwongella immobilis]VIP03695.1 Hemolysin-type calcium-binding region domain protein OS=Rhodopirellula maiorica SM1 GN=RMSM_03614 PE=4 SV=1: FG-GAP: VCBS [Tuwongella immobilis]VTS04758.1 Hemolysin-type calcium-binding region domain protein OS=Rhodopirellula maiorica SM1 GN=RMSM_03614 PE=4 SV=1: FG-GAP: VCBS [Tuwongella immobilis]